MFGYLDCSSGISGDMFLGALVGAGLDVETLRSALDTFDVSGWTIDAIDVHRAGIVGTQVRVLVEDGQPSRDWREIRQLIEAADGLTPRAREGALRAFGLLAEAEADVHGVAVDDVHFHEVGAVDSIVDIVGAAIGMDALGIEGLWASPVRIGYGSVMTSHGELPIPAPATAALLHDVPAFAGQVAGELTTPTGACLLRAFVTRFAPRPPMRVGAEGAGAGTLELPLPNLLRLSLGEREPGTDLDGLEEVAVLETVIDHVTPEHLAATVDLLLEDGALDAWTTAAHMKKGRLGAELTVLARLSDASRLADAVMRHTGTLGVRVTPTWRATAAREVREVTTSLGTVRVKVQGVGDTRRVRPENDDVVRIVRETGLTLDRVARTLTDEAEAALRSDR